LPSFAAQAMAYMTPVTIFSTESKLTGLHQSWTKVYSTPHLRSARRHYLVVPQHSLSSHGHRAFAIAGPTTWNSLSDDLRDPTLSTGVCLKLNCYRSTSTHRALEVVHFMHYTNSRLTCLLIISFYCRWLTDPLAVPLRGSWNVVDRVL